MSKKYFATFTKGIILCLLITTVSTGCSDDELLQAVGIVRDSGSFATGGCDWVIEINNDLFEPRILPAEFKIDGLTIELKYRFIRTEVNCPVSTNFAGMIHINKIRKL